MEIEIEKDNTNWFLVGMCIVVSGVAIGTLVMGVVRMRKMYKEHIKSNKDEKFN